MKAIHALKGYKYQIYFWPTFFKREFIKYVSGILICFNHKNPESDIRVNAKRSEKTKSQPLVLTSAESSDRMGDCVSL